MEQMQTVDEDAFVATAAVYDVQLHLMYSMLYRFHLLSS